jgi:site-specific DNA recombinase
MSRAALYARFSTDKQRDASIEDQFFECARVANALGYEIVARYSDKGISGGTHQRPGYQDMAEAARGELFDVIIAEDISRLWRNRKEYGNRSTEFEDNGRHVVTCVGDDTRRDGWMIVTIKLAMAEQQRKEASYRTRRGLEGNARSGKSTGGRAFGYIAARDSSTGQVEIHTEHSAVVRRIFELYAEGMAPRAIAAVFNEEGIPSPGASCKRSERRTDGKWLASAIHGDATRGTGILNNKRYIGIVTWGRSEWKRSPADSKQRRHRMLAKGSAHEMTEERLRIVPQALWERVKARQAQRSHTIGAAVKGALRRRAAGAGRPQRHLFSGLLRCGQCEAAFVISNGERYQCASHLNGRACTNTVSVRRSVVESVLLRNVKADLQDPEIIAEVERRVAKALAVKSKPKADNGKRIAELTREVENLADAIAGGLLKVSPALAKRLEGAESELQRLQEDQQRRRAPIAGRIMPSVGKMFVRLVEQLEENLKRDPQRARASLAEIFGERVVLEPDESGRFLWADYGIGAMPVMANVVGADSTSVLMVAGVGFEPTTFGL